MRAGLWAIAFALCILGQATAGRAQAPAESTQPDSATPADPSAEEAAPSPAPAPAAPPGETPAAAVPPAPPLVLPAGLPTLVPPSTNGGDISDVTLPEKPVAIFAGDSTWDEGFKNLSASFAYIVDAMAKAGLKPAGRPLAVFLSADDTRFHYEAMVPLAATPANPDIAPDVKAGVTPSGPAFRFVHKAPYDEIDTTYEAITAYLDSKNIIAKDAFIEEYVSDLKDPSDPNLEINVYVQPK
jgi:effector-binding domain-containing protein